MIMMMVMYQNPSHTFPSHGERAILATIAMIMMMVALPGFNIVQYLLGWMFGAWRHQYETKGGEPHPLYMFLGLP